MKKKLVLFYNEKFEKPLYIPKGIPSNIVITQNRESLEKADIVVFHIPDLTSFPDKYDGQLWVA